MGNSHQSDCARIRIRDINLSTIDIKLSSSLWILSMTRVRSCNTINSSRTRQAPEGKYEGSVTASFPLSSINRIVHNPFAVPFEASNTSSKSLNHRRCPHREVARNNDISLKIERNPERIPLRNIVLGSPKPRNTCIVQVMYCRMDETFQRLHIPPRYLGNLFVLLEYIQSYIFTRKRDICCS